MKNKRNLHLTGNGTDSLKIKLWRKFISTVCISHGDGKGIYSCSLHIILCKNRICEKAGRICISLCRIRIISHMSKLTLYSRTVRMGNFCHFPDFFHIYFIRICRAVVHNRRKTKLKRLQACFFLKTVIQMNHNRNFGFFCHRNQIIRYLFQRTVRKKNLCCSYNDRRLRCFCRRNNPFCKLNIYCIK